MLIDESPNVKSFLSFWETPQIASTKISTTTADITIFVEFMTVAYQRTRQMSIGRKK